MFFLLLCLVVLYRLIVLFRFGFEFTGTDDLIFWQMAEDYSKGIFREPYFYGQNYNFGIEALVAVPLIWVGIPYHVALPASTVFITLFPFVFFSYKLFKNNRLLPAFLVLILFVSLPFEYDLLTSMSRGFVNGLFFTSFLIIPLLHPQKKSSYIIFGLFASFGIIVNPNSVLVSFPIGVYLLLVNYREINFFIYCFVFAFPAIIIQYFSKLFYVNNPDFLAFSAWKIEFKSNFFLESFYNLDSFFEYYFPIFWQGKWLVLVVILVLGLFLLNKNKIAGIAVLSSLVLIIISLGITKVHNGLDTLYFSKGRMFLGIPLILSLTFYFIFNTAKVSVKRLKLIFVCTLVLVVTKSIFLPGAIRKHTEKTYYGVVAISSINDLKEKANYLASIMKQEKVDVIVFIPRSNYAYSEMALLAYGGQLIDEGFSESNYIYSDRRTWIWQKGKKEINKTVMLFNCELGLSPDLSNLNVKIIRKAYDVIVIKDNTKTIYELSKIFKFPYDRD